MQQATTKQFRNAVREAALQTGADLGGSWTDADWSRFDYTAPRSKRYVGFVAYGKALQVAQLAEALLRTQGLTANTRTGRRSHWMVRGTCVLA